MAYRITPEQVRIATLPDRPGGLAEKLEAVSNAGVDLDFLIARRSADQPGNGVVFLSPAPGQDLARAIEKAGLSSWSSANTVRIDGPDQAGLGTRIARAISEAGINLRGMSGARIGDQAAFHLAFDNADDAAAGHKALEKALNE